MTYPHDGHDEYDETIEEDLTQTDEAQGFGPAPAAQYFCRCIDVKTKDEDGEPRTTKNGDKSWGLRFEPVAVVTPDGKLSTKDPEKLWTGRSVWDNVTHSKKAAGRRKLVLGRMGVDVNRPFKLSPRLLLGRWVVLTVEIEEVWSNKKQKKVRKNSVPFDGYQLADPKYIKALVDAGREPQLACEREEKGDAHEEQSAFPYGANAQ